ncbi:MAG: dihydrolipoyl dehydrogenase [Clostridiales bacterium]|jgi:dihydrolipoamide dehydrogenase|nr:dihydrolipoyl dehydrogenase [Clostridiales bacterium]
MYDLIVLGGGPAGYLAAERAGHAGLKVLLIEKRALGGVCLNEGCIPSKALLHSAKVLDYAKHGAQYGVKAEGVSLDHKAVVARKNKVVKTLVSGVTALMKANRVQVAEGVGVITGKHTVAVNGTEHEGKYLLICTGSEPFLPPIPGVKEGLERGIALTNREILDLPELPRDLVVIGGGVIGLEMASYFNSAGSRVTVIEMLPRIAGATDSEISSILQKNYEEKGVTFQLNAKVTKITDTEVFYERGGESYSVPADKTLISVGRKPSTSGIGLEAAGVYCERGAIVTDKTGQTNIAGIYAAGDVNGKSMLAHTAYREAEVAVNNILGKKDAMRYNAIPSVIYTNPEAAAVGETEESAREKGLEIETVTQQMMYSGRYVAENLTGDGICKLIIAKKSRALLGVHLLGNYASEIIYGAGVMIETELRVQDVKELVFPHPTVCEIIKVCLGNKRM